MDSLGLTLLIDNSGYHFHEIDMNLKAATKPIKDREERYRSLIKAEKCGNVRMNDYLAKPTSDRLLSETVIKTIDKRLHPEVHKDPYGEYFDKKNQKKGGNTTGLFA